MMKPNDLNLSEIAKNKDQRVVSRLEGEIDDETARLWGEEFAASGGGKSPAPTPPVPAPNK